MTFFQMLYPSNAALDLSTGGKDPFQLAEEKFQLMIREVEDYAIFLLSPDGKVVSWNKGAEKIKGYAPAEIMGKSFKVFYPKEDLEKDIPDLLLKRATEHGKANHEGWRVKKDGNRFWGSVTITRLLDSEGNLCGFLKVTRDLTEKKTAEEKYANSLEDLRLKNEDLKKREFRYHQMVSEVQDYAIILLDETGKIVDWNAGAEKLKGYTAEEIIGKNIRLFYPAEDKASDLPERLLAAAVRDGAVTHEGYRIRKDGSRFWANVVITALHDDTGQLTGFTKVTKDLTERKIAEDKLAIFTEELKRKNEALVQSEERYHRMVAEVQDYAIIMLDTEGNIQNWNTGAELIKGYSANEIIGKSFKMFYLQEDLDRGLPGKLLKEAEKRGKANYEGWRKRKDGSRFWGNVVITALHNGNGDLIGFSKVTRDLTEKKRIEDELKKNALELELKNHELERLNEELSSFAYIVSHDLKEPVRKIQVFARRQLEPGQEIESFKKFSEKIIASARRMQNLMEALLYYSRLDSHSNHKAQVDLNSVLEDVKSDLELTIHERNATIENEALPTVVAVPFQMHQLFLNLLSNALKFSKSDERPRITISAKRISNGAVPDELIIKNRNYHQLTFKDNGIGFNPIEATRIFQVFQRLSSSDNGGTGIGLAIVKKVVDNHDGMVTAEGRPDEGATFTIYLPA